MPYIGALLRQAPLLGEVVSHIAKLDSRMLKRELKEKKGSEDHRLRAQVEMWVVSKRSLLSKHK
jgi:hypothetical protein